MLLLLLGGNIIEELLAGIIGACVTLIVAFYVTPFRNRQNSEVSTLHSESVWREKLFELASTLNEKDNLKNIELFRTFLSATRGIQNTYNIYDPGCRISKGKDLDDLCLYFYDGLQKDLRTRKKISAEKAQVLRQLCRLLLKSDWNTRTHPADFEQVNNEILYKAILLIAAQEDLTSLNGTKTTYNFYLSDGKIKKGKVTRGMRLTQDFKGLIDAVIANSPKKSYPWAITKGCFGLAILVASLGLIFINWETIKNACVNLWFLIPSFFLLIPALSIIVWQTYIIQNFTMKIWTYMRSWLY